LETRHGQARVLAVHLPQFHPIPENDAWWGPGFTEWTNVAKSRPWFPGHYQPHLPADLGFYDLRVRDAHVLQAELAREHGIHGFIYYHYWFHGKELLERPVNDMLSSGKPDFPFCLCWANESWTRSWTSRGAQVLIEQRYSEDDDLSHIRRLLPMFADRRYITVSGKPVFFVYRASKLPNARRTFDLWRNEAVKAGLPGLYLIRFEASSENGDPTLLGADAAAEFAPDLRHLPPEFPEQLPMQLLRKLRLLPRPLKGVKTYSYASLAERALARALPAYKFYRCVTPGWDNTPRRAGGAKGAWLTVGNDPEHYARWLGEVVTRRPRLGPDEDFVLINAWNEWAEGNHLEPCQRWGRAYLEATRRVLSAHDPRL
jgi:lipopolysaccharide biosynthesis protein